MLPHKTGSVGYSVKFFVVNGNNFAVLCFPKVKLDLLCAEGHSCTEGGHAVLGGYGAEATVGADSGVGHFVIG